MAISATTRTTSRRRPPGLGFAAVLAAGVCVLLLAGAAAARAEQLLQFGPLQEDLRSHAIEAFADADDPAGRSASATADTIRAAQRDLNGDGSPELLLIREDGKGCIDKACPVRVLERRAESWHRIATFVGGLQNIRVYRRRDHGYHRLGTKPVDWVHDGDNSGTVQVWWRDRYRDLLEFNEAVATWPGKRLLFRRMFAAERRIIAQRVWPGQPARSAGERQEDRDGDYFVSWVDLNDDGRKELILVATNPHWCGSIGCHSEILQRIGHQWIGIGAVPLSSGYVRILMERHNGYRMLAYTSLIFWTGKEYEAYGDGKDSPDD